MGERRSITTVSFPLLVLFAGQLLAEERDAGKPVALLEDNSQALLQQLTNPTGDPGQGFVEKNNVFSGSNGIRIVPMQRFHPGIPGWKFRITKNPKPGEYRYLRFAWKSDGCAGIMVQFHDAKGWNLRYTAGVDQHNWGSNFVADKPPSEWVLVTRDLYADFGERTLQGIALTTFGGRAGYFDHIYLGRSHDDLDRIDATGFRKAKQPPLQPADLEQLWRDLLAVDASKAYRALWRLVASPTQSLPFLELKLAQTSAGIDSNKLRKWIRELDDDDYFVREDAAEQLVQHLDDAVPLLENTLKTTDSFEVCNRIRLLFQKRSTTNAERERIAKAIRIFEYSDTKEATKVLHHFANQTKSTLVNEAAKAALARLAQRRE